MGSIRLGGLDFSDNCNNFTLTLKIFLKQSTQVNYQIEAAEVNDIKCHYK